MRKPLIALSLVLLIVMAQLIASAPTRKSLRAQLNPNYLRAMAAYKRLESKLPREELRAITTIGILNGAKQAEKQMERHLIDVVKDLVLHTDIQDKKAVAPKIAQIEQQMQRDQHALQILTSAMDLVTHNKDVQAFKEELQQMRQRTEVTEAPQKLEEAAAEEEDSIGDRVAVLRQNILQQVNTMKEMVEHRIENTLNYLIEAANEDGLLAKASNKVLQKRDTHSSREEPAEIRMINSILTEDDFRHNLIDNRLEKRKDELDELDSLDSLENLDLAGNKEIASRSSTTRQNGPNNSAKITAAQIIAITTTTTTTTTTEQPKLAKQQVEEGSPDIVIVVEPEDADAPPPPGGGLVGIITSLSGGEGGSDIGALIGSLTGVISTLFGPGGLDVESLISTGSSLFAGLLSGNRNFGTVLGIYVGNAFDGFSGGGGAVNNGQFVGNFLGTVVASLSADPEDDDEPPKPLIFAQNLLNSFLEAKNRKPDGENEERHDQKGGAGGAGGGGAVAAGVGGGSDSGGFIKHIVSHLVGSAVSLILNASIGASGGASHATSSLLATSSSHSKPAVAAGHGVKSW